MDKKKEVLKVVEKIVRVKVDNNRYGWPPPCLGFLHQPQRPLDKNMIRENNIK